MGIAQLFLLAIAATATCTVVGATMAGPIASSAGSARLALWVIAVADSAALLPALNVRGIPAAVTAATAAATLALPYVCARRRAAVMLGTLDAAAVGGCAGFVAARSAGAHPGWYVVSAAAIALAAAAALGAGMSLVNAPAGDRAVQDRRLARYLLGASTVLPAALVLALIPAGAPRATLTPGTPLLTSATTGNVPVTVLVAPGRPGWNLVHVDVSGASVGSGQASLVRVTARPATQYGWAELYLPPRRSQLWVGYRGQTAPVTVDTGTGTTGPDLRGRDGPECASAALGLALSHSTARLTTCPADRLDPADAAALRGMMRFIANRGIRAISLIADSSPRGTAARALVEAEAARYGMTIGGPDINRPMVIVSGWGPALAAVRDVAAGRGEAQGTYLAPWLVNKAILTPPAGQLLPLRFDPGGASALDYLEAVHAWFPGEAASADGYLAWSRAIGGQLRLYASSTISGASMGGMPGMPEPSGTMRGMPAAGAGGWLPDGGIVPVTGPLSVP